MAAGDIKPAFAASAAFEQTLASLTNTSARQGTFIDNTSNKFDSAIVFYGITSGGVAPTAGSTYGVYLLRRDSHASPTVTDDNAGSSDAGITIINATLIGVITVTASTATKFSGSFDTAPFGPLGPSWTTAIKNNSGQTISGTEADHVKRWVGKYDTVAQS
jgi:hypothetical protein